jgi:predicted amidohydrolase YtcJ
MCIVCGPNGARFLHAIADRYATAPLARSRFSADECLPPVTPPLDPNEVGELVGSADVILRAGPILTFGAILEAEAVAVKAGRIQFVGSVADAMERRGRLTRVVDLDGRTLAPGFVIADWHPPLSVLCDWCDLPAAPTAAMLAEALAGTSRVGREDWLIFRLDADQDALLDCVNLDLPPCPSPTIIIDRTGWILVVNPAARKLGASGAPTLIQDSRPSGAMHVSMLLPILLREAAVSSEPLRRRMKTHLREITAHGVTTLRICGLGTIGGAGDFATIRDLADEQPGLRLRGAIDLPFALRARDFGLQPGLGDDLCRIDTASGWVDSFDNNLAENVRSARAGRWRVTLHANDASGVDDALRIFEAACSDRFPYAEGDGLDCHIPPTPEIAYRLAVLGLSLGLTPKEETAEPCYEGRLQPARSIAVSYGLRAMAGAISPLDAAAAAMRGRSDTHAWETALRGVTIGAAKRCGVGGILGSIETGKYADFVFLDSDPREVCADAMSAIQCLETWIAGREVANKVIR